MNIDELRKNYPEFVYQNFNYQIDEDNLRMAFNFRCGEINFKPQLVFKNISTDYFASLDKNVIENLAFHLGLAEMPTYWKAFASPKIIVNAGKLDDEQIKWWYELFTNGMGQYFYENKIDFTGSNFLNFVCGSDKVFKTHSGYKYSGLLIPVGGGKDSAVTLELLKNKENSAAFIVNPMQASLDLIRISGINKCIEVERNIDAKLFELNKLGYLNGHTPYSSLIAFLSVASAYFYGYSDVALSNEQSSNEENTNYLKHKINHQYSKTFEFENLFREYIKKFVVNINYFSFLRPLHEIQIAKIFSKFDKYFKAFRSCNIGQKKNIWCANCAKCLSTYILLMPFLSKNDLINIFGEDLLIKDSLKSILQELIDPGKVKPFECVGTKEELKASLENNLTMLNDWNNDNNLTAEYETILRTNI